MLKSASCFASPSWLLLIYQIAKVLLDDTIDDRSPQC